MIKLENYEVVGWEHAIRGMRNPKNSWAKSDSDYCMKHLNGLGECKECPYFNADGLFCDHTPYEIGPNDHKLMRSLAKAGPVHAKYRRMITVYVDITAPLYWWKEFDTYKVGTVANSCSTMHKIHDKKFTLEDFSCEHLCTDSRIVLHALVTELNSWRKIYIDGGMVDNCDGTCRVFEPKDKDVWWQMIQLLPSSYNQKRTVMLNYEVLAGIYKYRKDHKLDEWRQFCNWIRLLPYSELIIDDHLEEVIE